MTESISENVVKDDLEGSCLSATHIPRYPWFTILFFNTDAKLIMKCHFLLLKKHIWYEDLLMGYCCLKFILFFDIYDISWVIRIIIYNNKYFKK